MFNTVIRAVIVTLAFAVITSPLAAACLAPIQPKVETRSVVSLNSFAKGYRLCIVDFDAKNSCDFCESGFAHVCDGSVWRPQTLKCSKGYSPSAFDQKKLEQEKEAQRQEELRKSALEILDNSDAATRAAYENYLADLAAQNDARVASDRAAQRDAYGQLALEFLEAFTAGFLGGTQSSQQNGCPADFLANLDQQWIQKGCHQNSRNLGCADIQRLRSACN